VILPVVLLVLLIQLLIGTGIVRTLRYAAGPLEKSALGMLVGMPVSTLGIIVLDCLGIRLTLGSMLSVLTLVMLGTNIDALRCPRVSLAGIKPRHPSLRLYDAPFLLVLLLLVAISVERGWHLPVTLRDMIVGPDLVAKYAVEQGTLVSSVFTDVQLRGHLSNQPFYAPFTMLMQVIFRLTGHPFGQIWSSVMFLAFLAFLYGRLRDELHPVLAGCLTVVAAATPELFAESFMVTVDFANAIFLGLAVVLLGEAVRTGNVRTLVLSALFMGFACWSRTETILFVPVAAGVAVAYSRRCGRARVLRDALICAGVPIAFFAIWHVGYFYFRLPLGPDSSIRLAIPTIGLLSKLIVSIGRLLGYPGIYGYLLYIFSVVAAVNVLALRDRWGAPVLLWVPVLLLGFVAIVILFPAAAVETTVKRGLLKLTPIMALYLGETLFLQRASRKLYEWECRDAPDSRSARLRRSALRGQSPGRVATRSWG
jgi:hypothetical protein